MSKKKKSLVFDFFMLDSENKEFVCQIDIASGSSENTRDEDPL